MRERRDANALRCRTRLVLSKEEDFFGPGVYELLKAIGETGSIQAAAARMHMSYTKAWKMINQAEKEMGFLFLNRLSGGKNGGSSEITEEGRRFMERYHAMGFSVRAWGIYTEALMVHACACGVDGMTVNFPDVLEQWLRKRG